MGEAGFTFLDLMMVVAVLGALTVVAVPRFVKYMRKSRTVEVIDGLTKIASGAQVYYSVSGQMPCYGPEGALCTNNTPYTPAMTHATACQNYAGTFPESTNAQFAGRPWKHLLFTPVGRQRYRYAWWSVSTLTTADGRAHATGDLDCDGVLSIWHVHLVRRSAGRDLERRGPWVAAAYETE